MEFPGWDGFLGTRATFLLDAVCLAMVIVVSILAWSVRQVRKYRRYGLHKRVQLSLAAVLAVVLVAFEIDIRLHGWQERAAGQLGGSASATVMAALAVHLCFAVSTVVLWLVVIVLALRRFPNPPEPNAHSPFHRRWGLIAAWDMVLTTVTGWVFYIVAFVL